MTKTLIEAKLAAFPRVDLSLGATPLHALPRLSESLGCHIHALREDLTGFALGGNKVRKLDYLVGDALAREAEVLLTSGATSFSRNAAAAGQRFGLDVHVVVPGAEEDHNPASRAVFDLFAATLHHGAEYAAVFEDLASGGRRVCELHPGGSDEIGSLGYLRVFDQIVAHSAAAQLHFDALVLASGSSATQVGLVLGQSLTGYATRTIGMAISQPAEVQRGRVLDLARSTADRLEIELDESLVHVEDGYLGEGYARPTSEARAAARTFAELEGLLLDPVYSGKAAAGLIDYARRGRFAPSENVLFIHTGGNSGLFDG